MDTTIKKTTEIISIVNQSTREYLNNLIDNQTAETKVLAKIDIDKAFDDMILQTKSHDLNSFQRNFIIHINYFIRKAVLRWFQMKKGLEMGNTIDKKDINFVFDQMAESVLKTTIIMNEKTKKRNANKDTIQDEFTGLLYDLTLINN